MPNRMKEKGDRAEREAVATFHRNGFPAAERTRAGYFRDAGDIHLTPGVISQVKDRKQYAWPEWLQQLADQKTEANADHAFLMVKRPGFGQGEQWLGVMPVEDLLNLIRAAGYGENV